MLLFSGGLLFALGLLLIGNEGFYYFLKNLMGKRDRQSENPTPVWATQNYGRYIFGILMIIGGIWLVHMWQTLGLAIFDNN
jgi:hypothetical protein